MALSTAHDKMHCMETEAIAFGLEFTVLLLIKKGNSFNLFNLVLPFVCRTIKVRKVLSV
jgi:hypothetical protein